MSNEILKFGDTATNILTQAEYAADSERNSGNLPGIARSKLVNKALRQCAFMSNAFAEYLVSIVGGSVLDDNDTTALVAKMTSAFTIVRTNPNDIINGNFDTWQRGTTFTVSATNTWTADRFVEQLVGSTSVVTRQATAGTESFNAKYFMRTAVTSSAGATNYYRKVVTIEDVRRYAGKTVTFSFWAKADSARNIAVEAVQNFGTGGSPSAEVTAISVSTKALTTSWVKHTITVTFPSISGKVIGTNENSYTALNFWFDAGSSFNARTSSLGQQSGTFDVAQFKSEVGTVATEFCLAGTTQQSDYLACLRYLWITTGNQLPHILANVNTATTAYTSVVAPLRASPTVTFSGLFQNAGAVASANISAVTNAGWNPAATALQITSSGMVAGQCTLVGGTGAGSYLSLSSELF